VYDIVVNNNEYIGPQTVSTMGINITVNIRSASSSDPKTIQLEGNGYLFSVDTGLTLKLQDIVLKGHSMTNVALVAVGQGKLILNSGGKITFNVNNNTSRTGGGGGVHINGGVLEMNEGSEITSNKVAYDSDIAYKYGGGVYVENQGMFNFRGGIISDNIVDCARYNAVGGGGIYITGNSTVTMTGGIISKNTCVAVSNTWGSYGGGIYITNGSSFTKRAASGNGTSGIIYGGTGENANAAANGGQAIYRDFGSLKERNSTLGGYDEISTGNDVGWE
jgi:hypothetical protein